MSSVIDLWNKCLSIIREEIVESAFETWFKPIIPLNHKENKFVLQVPTMLFYEYIEAHYSETIKNTINRVVGEETNLLYSVAKQTPTLNTNPESEVKSSVQKPQSKHKAFSPFDTCVKINFDSQLNSNYRFDNFIEGISNKLVRSVGLSIADSPKATVFNPLFVHGASGVGKTHVANAIGIETKEKFPEKRVLYVSANLFQIQYTDAVMNNNQNDFLNFYQSLDVLIIDDVHELMAKSKTQKTFFNIFNHLHRLGKQIILTCDRSPSELTDIEDRLLTRFRWGLTAEITKPDIELRKNILRHKIAANKLTVPEEVIDFIAENVTENIRDLEGILLSLLAHSTINQEQIGIELAQKLIDITPKEGKKINIDHICDLVCEHYSLSQESLFSQSRKAEIAQPRQVAMYLARKHTSYSLDAIGSTIGKRTHATVMHSCKLIDGLLKNDKHLQKDIQILESKIR